MRNFTKILVLFAFPIFSFAQGRLILNDNAFIIISNSAKVVIENPNPNAITTTGTGGNIVSEGENNQIVWDIANTTGNYVIPWTTRPVAQGGNGVKIPMGMNLTGAGDAGGFFVFSTYETATDANLAYPTYPTPVTTMDGANTGLDAALFVVDRFWILDNTSYTTIPNATLSFNYDDNANEIAGSNTLTEANLRAQRWNITDDSWETLLFGNTNTATNVTNNVVAAAADFWPVWILVDLTVPLPVDLQSQSASSLDCQNQLTWTVTKETNCSHYEIKRSYDGDNWENIAEIAAQGSSSSAQTYSYRDDSFSNNGFIYYQIEQYDFDGTAHKFEVLTTNSFCTENEAPILYPNPVENLLNIKVKYQGTVKLFDATGRLVEEKLLNPLSNALDLSKYAAGAYSIQIQQNTQVYNFKIIKTIL